MSTTVFYSYTIQCSKYGLFRLHRKFFRKGIFSKTTILVIELAVETSVNDYQLCRSTYLEAMKTGTDYLVLPIA